MNELFDREPEMLVRVDPVGYTANIRLVVRNPGLLAVVADFSTEWDSRIGARGNVLPTPLPHLNSIYLHFWSPENYEHTPCEYSSVNSTDGCRMHLCMDYEVQKQLPHILAAKGSSEALEYLKEQVYLPEVNGEE